ncbi:MAG: glycosyl hydrolase family 18 protein [Ignavibacteriales bacterium]
MLIQKNFLIRIFISPRTWIPIIHLSFTTGSAFAQTDLWATAYYAGWMQGQYNNGHLPAQEIDFSAMTHIVHFSLVPNPDGTLDALANSITETNSSELISRAHAEGVKVIISIGGWNSGTGFRGASNPLNLVSFVTNLVNFMTTRGYDGIDIDWEPLESSDATLYIALITALGTAFNAIQPKPILTAANGGEPEIYSQIHQYFDQINLMTYDMSGPWPGWVTWHNSPIYNGGFSFPCCPGNYLPSADGQVDAFIEEGIPLNKIGIGIDFYGYIWNGGDGTSTGGVSEPRQEWTAEPWMQGNVPYYTIMEDYFQTQFYHWDDDAKSSYLSIDNSGSANDKFISYDEETAIEAKFDYARSKGIGGLIIWELGGGYRPNMPQGQRDLLLQAVKIGIEGGVTGINEPTNELPAEFTLEQNYPNPFNPSTTIQFSLTNAAQVELKIYNLLGENVATLVNENLNAGLHSVNWDASKEASGIYLYQLRSGSKVITKKMTLTK